MKIECMVCRRYHYRGEQEFGDDGAEKVSHNVCSKCLAEEYGDYSEDSDIRDAITQELDEGIVWMGKCKEVVNNSRYDNILSEINAERGLDKR